MPSNQALELAVAGGHLAARQAEELAEADVVLPELLALGRRSAAAPSSRTSPGRSRRSPPASTASAPGRRPSRRRRRGGRRPPRAASPLIRSCRRWTAASALSASARVPRKTVSWILAVRARRLNGRSAERGAQHRAGVGERLQRPDQQRPLAVEQADRALAVDAARHRAAGGEVVGPRRPAGHLGRECYSAPAARAQRERAAPSSRAAPAGSRSSWAAKISSRSSRVSVSRSSALAARSSRQSRLRGEQRARAAVGLAGQRHRRQVDVAAGPVGERVVAGRQRDRRRARRRRARRPSRTRRPSACRPRAPGRGRRRRPSRTRRRPPPRRRGRRAG